MRVFLDIIAGPYIGSVIQMESGMTIRVGQSGKAEAILADDHALAPVHFALSCDDKSCNLFDWGSKSGTFQNGERVYKSTLSNGDKISAGETTLLAYVETGVFQTPDDDEAAKALPETPISRLLQLLRSQTEPLYALLDAARDPQVLELLRDTTEEYQSLYEGDTQEELAEVAPYLIHLPPSSAFTETLLRKGWGKSWGVFLTSKETFKTIRKHFRFLQFVEDEDGQELYFRFYDPRVLRVYLPACNANELRAFFGLAGSYIIEDESPLTALHLKESGDQLQIRRLALI